MAYMDMDQGDYLYIPMATFKTSHHYNFQLRVKHIRIKLNVTYSPEPCLCQILHDPPVPRVIGKSRN